MSQGVIVTIKDLVVRVEFASQPPDIGELLVVKNSEQSPLLTESYLNDTIAVCLNLRSSKKIQKGMLVETTGKGIEIPVGQATIGRIFDALGNPVDGQDPIPADNPRKNILKLSSGQKAIPTLSIAIFHQIFIICGNLKNLLAKKLLNPELFAKA